MDLLTLVKKNDFVVLKVLHEYILYKLYFPFTFKIVILLLKLDYVQKCLFLLIEWMTV